MTMIQVFMSFLRMIFGMNKKTAKAAHHAPLGDIVPKGPGPLTQVLQPAYTVRLRPEQPEQEAANGIEDFPPEKPGVPVHLSWHGATDTGAVRDHNEDSFSHLSIGDKRLFIVADGMGGHDAGEVASRLAVDEVCRKVSETAEGTDPMKIMDQAVRRANAEVKREGMHRGSNMGTTVNAALIAGDSAYIANVGDSRAYWIENGSITQITEDHSLVAKLAAMGKLTKEEARNHPRSNLLYRTIGTDEAVKVDTFRVALKKGGVLLLCTDGLWNEVADEDIHHICTAEKDVKKACARLLETANRNGGRDNITAVVVRVE